METPYLTIGKIINTRGLKGELKIASMTDFPLLRYRKGSTVYLEKDGQYIPLIVKQATHQPGIDFVQFQDHQDINLVKGWMNLLVYALKDDIRLKAGTYYFAELTGMTVINKVGQTLGKIITVERIAERVLLRMKKNDEQTVLIPFLDVFVQRIDRETRTILVTLPEGMG